MPLDVKEVYDKYNLQKIEEIESENINENNIAINNKMLKQYIIQKIEDENIQIFEKF